MFRTFGAPEIILILVIVLIFFGVGKLPQVGSALGKGLHAFKRGQSGEGDEEGGVEEVTKSKPRKRLAKSKKMVEEGS